MVRLSATLLYFVFTTQVTNSASIPDAQNVPNVLQEYAAIASDPRSTDVVSPVLMLERRKGGGGRGGGGGSSGSSGGRGSSGGGGGGSSSRTSGTSMVGGSTRQGSGASRTYGRGGYYGGGAAVPYQAGKNTQKGLVAGPLLVGGAALAIMPGVWLYSVYPYYYNNQYRFWNRTANATNNNNNNARGLIRRQEAVGVNETLPVVCLCQEYSVCGCEENTDQAYLNDLIGNGSYAALNKSLVTVSVVKDKRTIVINGTLPNGTTAPGGTDDAATSLSIGRYSGYWAMGLIVLYGVFM